MRVLSQTGLAAAPGGRGESAAAEADGEKEQLLPVGRVESAAAEADGEKEQLLPNSSRAASSRAAGSRAPSSSAVSSISSKTEFMLSEREPRSRRALRRLRLVS